MTVEIIAYGNCFHRAFFYALLGKKNSHALIHQDITNHIEKRGTVLEGIISAKSSEFSLHIFNMRTLGKYGYIGEDTILVACDLYQREMPINTSFLKPLLYYLPFGDKLM